MSFWYLIKISTRLSKLSHSPQFPLQGLDVLLAVEYRTLQTGDFLLVDMTAFSYTGLRQRFLRFAQCFTLIAQLCFQNRTAASACRKTWAQALQQLQEQDEWAQARDLP